MASSSKKKSSKKKSSKLSSKTKKIKKSHRNASKKIGRRHDSSSEDSVRLHPVSVPTSDSNSDNDSASLLSMSSSGSEGTYRSRKKGSRLKKDKTRASRKPSNNEDLAHGKKRKRSKKKKKGHHESRKKSQKKKHRRHASISSVDGDSSSSTSEESDIQMHRSKFKENKKRRVESEVGTVLNKERTDKSPKGSSNSRSSDQSNSVSRDQENFVGENKPMRLKSVITVVVKPHEEEEYTLEKDDISSTWSKREELMNEPEKDSSGDIQTDDSPGGNSLEAVLRRKALENLKKFRGKVETDVKTIGDDIGKNAVVMKKTLEPGSSNVNEIKKDDIISNQLSIAKEKFVWRRLPQQVSNNVTGSAVFNESLKNGEHGKSSEATVKVNDVDPFDTSLFPRNPIKEHVFSQAFDTKSDSGRVKHSGMQKTKGVSSGKEVIVDKATEANHATSSISSDDDHKRKIKDDSAPISTTGHPNDQKNEAKQGSDFKEKKMSVMRGGEMVEVSYKVYIPQRAPGLARRQLKR